MAMLISRATGNFTAAATWGVADSATGSQLTNPSASTNTTTSYVYSSTFTGTNTRVSDGIALFLKRLNTTGTVTVALSDDNGVTATRSVTVNASDLPADESWVFFKFGTTLTLDGGTDYRVGVVASDADNALIYRDGTAGNWARMVSTTTTAAPATLDTLLIVGEWTGAGASSSYTVTMDSTSTTLDIGSLSTVVPTQINPGTYNGIQICQNGTLTWGSSAATNYHLRISGNLVVWSGGTYNMGTSGTPCPRNSTMLLRIDGSGPSGIAIYLMKGSVFNAYGQSRTAGKDYFTCKLSSDVSAGGTTLTVDTDTGWLDNDAIAISSTTRTATQSEKGLLNGAAGALTLTVDGFAGAGGSLAFAHSGTSPTQAEIILLTRNVVIFNDSSSVANLNIGTSTTTERQSTAQVNLRWVEFRYSGINLFAVGAGYLNAQYCSFGGTSTASAILQMTSATGTSNTVFSNNVCFSSSSVNLTLASNDSSTNNIVQNNIILCASTSGTVYNLLSTPTLSTVNSGTFSGNVAVGGTTGFSIPTPKFQVYDLVVHSCSGTGISMSIPISASNFNIWRTGITGLTIGTASTTNPAQTILNGLTIFGCTTRNISITGACSISNAIIAGDSSFSTGVGAELSGFSGNVALVNFSNCSFSPTSGIYTAHTTADIALPDSNSKPQILLSNTELRAATEISNANASSISALGFIKSSKHDQTEGAFKSWFQGGIIERDSTLFNTAAPSERLTPTSATIKLASGSRLGVLDDGTTKTISVYVRKSATGDGAQYNGNQPRLIVKANPAMGINTDTVLDTMTAAVGSWEQLTATTPAVNADGALEFYVDCDGTAGWVNVDDWSVT